jgi:hypothetical protein
VEILTRSDRVQTPKGPGSFDAVTRHQAPPPNPPYMIATYWVWLDEAVDDHRLWAFKEGEVTHETPTGDEG